MGRAVATELARELVRNLDLVARERRLAMIDGPRGTLSLPSAVQAGLIQAMASTIQDPTLLVTFRVRDELSRLAEIARNLRERGLRRISAERTDVLLVPRTEPHMRDMLRFAPRLVSDHGLRVSWATFRAVDARRARALGQPVINASALALSSAGAQAVLRLQIRDVVREVRERLPQHAQGLDAAHAYLQRNAPYATHRYAALGAVYEAMQPKVVVVGNATLMEGRVASHLAHKHAARVVMVQHGDIIAGKEQFEDVAVDRYCVWGPRTKDLLVQSQVPPDHVVVVGAPWLDAGGGGERRATTPPTILVALSGAGHMVGPAEHRAAVDALFASVAELPDSQWIIRVHPKDDPEPYRALAKESGHGRVSIVAAKDSKLTIHDQLAAASALVTIMSTSAVDAMLARVPVVTLGRAPSEHEPDYVRAGATNHVEDTQSISKTLRMVLTQGEPVGVAKRAREFAERFYGPLDGRAAQRVAAQIADDAKTKSDA